NLSFRAELGATARETKGFVESPWGVWIVLVPAAGGLFIGLLRIVFPQTVRAGISEIMAAVQARGGIIRARTAWGHAAISAVTVGTGGSTGREGPIAYIGAALGSSLSRRAGFRPRDIKVLLGCGTSAGIAATFNAPLGGVLLALELILPEFSTHAFIPLVVATVVGVTVGQFFLDDQATFLLPDDLVLFQSPWELAIYLALGILCGLGGVLFIRLLGRNQQLWDAWRVPEWMKPVAGGLLVGAMGYGVFWATGRFEALGGTPNYHLFGTGYPTVNAILNGETFVLAAGLLILLILVKPFATAFTVASGGGGGVFGASLFLGSIYGAAVGLAANALFPSVTAPASAYALVGMGAFYAATGRATLATIVLISELTNTYTILLPLMFACVSADAVSVALSRDSIYTDKLTKTGILFDHDRIASPLDFLQVKDVMSREVHTLPADLSAGEAFNRMIDIGHTGFPVVDGEGALVGIVTRRDLSRILSEGKGGEPLRAVLPGTVVTCLADEMLHRARDRLFEKRIGRLPVVDAQDRRRVVGILTRSDLLRAEAERDVEHEDT
ncbi:MAG TPA: chloride channel protein, partial [Candidatus Thermoplasmatota archaeon]|nr:chloride channel protein [Candidatus Thermoplasmatota archaeon]